MMNKSFPRITNFTSVINLPYHRFVSLLILSMAFCVVADSLAKHPLSKTKLAKTKTEKRFQFTGSAMGVPLNISLYCANAAEAEAAIESALARVQEINEIFSTYTETSELAGIHRENTGEGIVVSSEFYWLLEKSRQIADVTRGAFDPAIGNLTQRWKEAIKSGEMPLDLDNAAELSGVDKILLKQNGETSQVVFPVGLKFDFGGIGKGYAADQALTAIRKLGHRRAMVDLGGDLALGEAPTGRSGWRVAIASPKTRSITRFVELSNCGVATSGDTEQYVVIDGNRYSHVIDPATGMGLQRRAHVTVIAHNATEADAFASACNVMSCEDAITACNDDLAWFYSAACLVQESSNGKVKETLSRNFPMINRVNK